MKKKVELSVILPVHNEEKSIEVFLSDLIELLHKHSISFELICVENGSTDNSYRLLKSLGKKHKQLLVVRSKKGWGNAVRKGLKFAHGQYIAYMVTDGQIDSKHLIDVYDQVKKKEVSMVKIKRVKRENATRFLNSRFYNILSYMMFQIPSQDINGTPKVLRNEVFDHISLSSQNITLDLELMLKMKTRGYRWLEIPVSSGKRSHGTSTTNLKSVWEMITYMLHYYVKKHSFFV